MSSFATVVGWCVIVAAVIGSVVPGMNCHIFVGSDKEGVNYHRAAADRIEKRLQRAAQEVKP